MSHFFYNIEEQYNTNMIPWITDENNIIEIGNYLIKYIDENNINITVNILYFITYNWNIDKCACLLRMCIENMNYVTIIKLLQLYTKYMPFKIQIQLIYYFFIGFDNYIALTKNERQEFLSRFSKNQKELNKLKCHLDLLYNV